MNATGTAAGMSSGRSAAESPLAAPRSPGPLRPALADDLIGRADSARRRRQHHASRPADPSAYARQLVEDTDRANLVALWRIVTRIGWPGRWQVGDAGCQAAVEIAVHADHDVHRQKTLLATLTGAVLRGDATTAQWAHLADRCEVNAGHQQTFGTQYWLLPGGPHPHPIAEPEALDTRRAGVGLPPYGEQLHRLLRRHHDRLRPGGGTQNACGSARRILLPPPAAHPAAGQPKVLATTGGIR